MSYQFKKPSRYSYLFIDVEGPFNGMSGQVKGLNVYKNLTSKYS